ncbi:MAG: integration host factor subunit beta [Pseudomonadota bacterium]|nr:integration host factor subunit beta [Pseudomonadota bacterium]
MTKSELIEQLTTDQDHNLLTYHDVQLGLMVILESMANALSRGERIEVRGFGSFTLHYRKARIGRNPKTGSSVHVPDKYIPGFRPSQKLRQRVDNKS